METIYIISGILICVVIFFQALKKIKANPPYKGQKTFLGKKIPGKVYKEGWGFYLFYPFLYGFIPIKVATIDFSIKMVVMTCDGTSSEIEIFLTVIPLEKYLINYIISGKEEGIKKKLTGQMLERAREWCIGKEEGPYTWKELKESQREGIFILLKRILEKTFERDIPEWAQIVPTWIWIRYYTKPRPTKPPIHEIPWAGENGKWEKIEEIIKKHTGKDVQNLKDAIEERKNLLCFVRSGSAKIELESLGIKLIRLNLGEATPLGKVGELAEAEAKEEQEKKAETLELEHVAERIKALMKKRPEGPGLTLEQAIEQVQLTLKQATKNIDAKTITFDATTAIMIAKILGGING